jgi:L-ribulose-5-phosphate 3-epimerase
MKKGISYWAFPPGWTMDRCFGLARDAGFDGIELSYSLDGLITRETKTSDLKALVQQARRAGLEICSMASGVFWKINFISDDDAERANAKKHLKRILEIASDLEVRHTLVVPGLVGPFEAGAPVIKDYETTYRRAVTDLKEITPTAEKLGVAIGIENVWNKFLSSALEMRSFIDEIGSPMLGSYFDVGNVLRSGYPEHWIKILGKRIKGVHFKDFKVNVGTLQGFVDLFEGDVNYPAVMSALKEIGYDGWCVVEVFARQSYPESVVLRAGTDINRIFKEAGQ